MVLRSKHKNKLLYSFLFLLMCIGMVFTDLPIYNFTVAHSLMIFIAPLVFMFILIINNFKIPLTKNLKFFALYITITFSFSLLLLVFLILTKGGDFFIYNKDLLVKDFEAFISFSLLHFIVYFCLIWISINLSLPTLIKFIYFIFIFLTLAGFAEYLNPQILNMFHSFPVYYTRLRLFTPEPSQAILLYTIFGLFSLYFAKSVYSKILILIPFSIIFILIGSKGGFIVMFLISIVLFFKKLHNVKYLFIFLIILLTTTYFFFKFVIPSLQIDIKYFTSFATRSSSLISLIIILFTHPFGLGYGSYLAYYPKILNQSYEIANNLFTNLFGIPLSYNEIFNMVSTGEYLGAKGGIPQSIVFNGWFAVVFWLLIFRNCMNYIKKLINNPSKIILEFLVFFIFIQLLIDSDLALMYAIWLPIGFIEALYYKQQTGGYTE